MKLRPSLNEDPHRTKNAGFFCRTGFGRHKPREVTVQPFDLMSRRHPLFARLRQRLRRTQPQSAEAVAEAGSIGAARVVPSAPTTHRQESLPVLSKSGETYFFFLATLRVFFAVFFTALFAFFAFLAFLAIVPSDLSEMAFNAACTRESRCTTSRIHQHSEKNSVPLKEVLTRRPRQMQRASTQVAAEIARDDARSAGKIDTVVCQGCRKCLCRSAFLHSSMMRMMRG